MTERVSIAVPRETAVTWNELLKSLLAAFALHAVFAVVGWFVPPSMNSDSATGFYVWDCWRAGAPWNHMVVPDTADISRDISVFQAWWSPGQYLVIAPWQLLGLSLGQAIAVGGFAATSISLLGFWRLFRGFGFSPQVAGWAVLAAACNWTMTRTYGDYMGGETALLAVLPWLVIATRRALDFGWWSWVSVPALYWVGAMAKNSYIPIGAGLIAGFRGIRLWGRPCLTAPKFGEAARWLTWFGLGHFLFWVCYLRLGTTPGSIVGGPVHPDWWISLLRLSGFPVSNVFSLGTITGRIFMFPGHPLVSGLGELWPLHLLIAVVGLSVLFWLLRREFGQRPVYARMLVGVIAANWVFYLLVLLWRDSDGFDERFFKPVGFLLLPVIVDSVVSAKPRRLAWILGVALLGSSTYGIAAFANRAHHLENLANKGRRGTTQHVISREALRVLHTLDSTLPPNSLLVVPSPEIALEVQHTRVLSTHAVIMPVAQIAAQHFRGRVDNLVVLLDKTMRDSGRSDAFLAGFHDYPAKDWAVHRYGNWYFYHQGSFAGWPKLDAP